MGTKKDTKIFLTLIEILVVAAVGAGCLSIPPASPAEVAAVNIQETAGNVQFYDANENEFLVASVDQKVAVGQYLVTGEDSWVRLNAFEDGTALHLGSNASILLLSIGEQDGIPYARMRVDQGAVTLVPRSGRVYLEVPGGMAYADDAASALKVVVGMESAELEVGCLAGTCRFNHAAGGIVLQANQKVLMENNLPVVIAPKSDVLEKTDVENLAPVAVVEQGQPVESADYECGPPDGWGIYTVGESDSFAYLLKKYQVSSEKFRQANCLGDFEMVVAGLHLFVPAVALAAAPALPSPTQNTGTNGNQNKDQSAATSTLPPTQAPTQASPEAPTPAPTQVPTQAPTQVPEGRGNMRMADIIQAQKMESNPGMGWQYQGGTYPITDPAETVAYAPRAEISWRVLNPSEGVYDWSELDSHLNLAVSQGKQFSFRIYTMRGEDFGGHHFPQWVVDKGAFFLPSGEPSYASCVYQQEWGKFVNKLVQRYDGNPDIAFIDISGYGNFNEWSWRDDQTEWDDAWASAYANGNASRDTMETMDSFARRVLADMFIGGSYSGHKCLDANGSTKTVSYSYNGFEQTQLLMPYAGLRQSTQYVFTMDKTAGFRHDCLGRASSNDMVKDNRLGKEIDQIWPVAPVIFETCKPWEFSIANADYLLAEAHGSLVHDVNIDLGPEAVRDMVEPIGYRYELRKFEHNYRIFPGGEFLVTMEWQNTGYAPSYSRMGQKFELHVYFYNDEGQLAADILVDEDISKWMPAANAGGTPPTYAVSVSVPVGDDIPDGVYSASVQIIDARTGDPIWLPFVVNP